MWGQGLGSRCGPNSWSTQQAGPSALLCPAQQQQPVTDSIIAGKGEVLFFSLSSYPRGFCALKHILLLHCQMVRLNKQNRFELVKFSSRLKSLRAVLIAVLLSSRSPSLKSTENSGVSAPQFLSLPLPHQRGCFSGYGSQPAC